MCWIDLDHMPSWKNCCLFTNCENSTWPLTAVLWAWCFLVERDMFCCLKRWAQINHKNCKIALFGWKQCFIFLFKQIKNLSYEPLHLLLLKQQTAIAQSYIFQKHKKITWLIVKKKFWTLSALHTKLKKQHNHENSCIWKLNRLTEIKSVWAVWIHKKSVILLKVQRTARVNKCTGLFRK